MEQENKSKKSKDEEKDENGGQNRPSGTRTAKDSTGINIKDEKPINEKMPSMPPA